MKIYTKTGDRGETALFGGGRVSKAHLRVEAYGAVDELNAALGSAMAHIADVTLAERLTPLQSDLFSIGAHLATPPAREGRKRPDLPELPGFRVEQMEDWLDELADVLPELRAFVLPGGTVAAAMLHLARTICRRAERRVVTLAKQDAVDDVVLVYLNRLSDLLFQLARDANRRAERGDVEWRPGADGSES